MFCDSYLALYYGNDSLINKTDEFLDEENGPYESDHNCIGDISKMQVYYIFLVRHHTQTSLS